jgi:RNA polymerase sigma-70 factor (ECF subfamily)
MQRYAAGDDAAFNGLYRLLAPRLYRYCVSLCGAVDAEEVLQEVFLKMHRARARFVDSGGVFAWAFAIARTTHLDRVRYQKRRRELALEAQHLEQQPANEQCRPDNLSIQYALRAGLSAELDQLSENLQAAYVLVKIEGMTCAEASVALGISVDAVKQRVHRAALLLQQSLLSLATAA